MLRLFGAHAFDAKQRSKRQPLTIMVMRQHIPQCSSSFTTTAITLDWMVVITLVAVWVMAPAAVAGTAGVSTWLGDASPGVPLSGPASPAEVDVPPACMDSDMVLKGLPTMMRRRLLLRLPLGLPLAPGLT